MLRRSRVLCSLVMGSMLLWNPTQAAGSSSLEMAVSLQDAFVQVAEKVGPTVVSITTEQVETVGVRRFYVPGRGYLTPEAEEFLRYFFGDLPSRNIERRSMGLGSGFIVDADGYILTNEHVVAGADTIKVMLADGREFPGEVVGVDRRSDLAVVKIEAADLPVASLGDSKDVKIGQWAIAIGNPFGHIVDTSQPTVTTGIVSAMHRSLPLPRTSDRIYTGLIQTDASINQGNSGGPLVDITGKVIGINTAILSPTGSNIGVGFAIPINTAKSVIDDLIQGKRVRYGWLGVSVQEVDKGLAEYFGLREAKGALIVSVLEGGPADKGSLHSGDIVRSLNGEPISDTKDLLSLVGRAPVGSIVDLVVWRGGRKLSLKVKIGERPDFSAEEGEAEEDTPRRRKEDRVSWRGMEVMNITPGLANQLSLPDTKGTLIIKVHPEGPAQKANLRKGDVVEGINHRPVSNLHDFRELTEGVRGNSLIKTRRGYTVIPE